MSSTNSGTPLTTPSSITPSNRINASNKLREAQAKESTTQKEQLEKKLEERRKKKEVKPVVKPVETTPSETTPVDTKTSMNVKGQSNGSISSKLPMVEQPKNVPSGSPSGGPSTPAAPKVPSKTSTPSSPSTNQSPETQLIVTSNGKTYEVTVREKKQGGGKSRTRKQRLAKRSNRTERKRN